MSSSSGWSVGDINKFIKQLPRNIEIASKRIKPYIYETPLFYSQELSDMMIGNNSAVYLKLESEQVTGSFKARGSLNKILSLNIQTDLIQRGVVTSSTGNHAQGFARAISIAKTTAKAVGVDGVEASRMKGIIYLPKYTSETKKRALMKYKDSIELKFHDSLDCADTEVYAKEQAHKNNQIWISPYNDPVIITGQGTVGREMFQQNPFIDVIYVTVGGGGLISGIAGYYKSMNPNIIIVGCQPQNSCEMFQSVQQGHIVSLDKEHTIPTLSDGSAGGIEPNSITYDICRALVDRFILVSEDEIKHAIKFILRTHHKVIEGAAAVAVAAYIKSSKSNFMNDKHNIAIVVCGCNISNDILKDILNDEDDDDNDEDQLEQDDYNSDDPSSTQQLIL